MAIKKQKIMLLVLLVVFAIVQVYNIYRPPSSSEVFYKNYVQLTESQQLDSTIIELLQKYPDFLDEMKKNKQDLRSQENIVVLSAYLCENTKDKDVSEAYCGYALFIAKMYNMK